jgi:hypothetical protein
MKYTDLHCVRCSKAVEPSVRRIPERNSSVTPADALLFISYGNYGSTAFDPVSDCEYLCIIICDACAVALSDAGNVMHVQRARPAVTRRTEAQRPWREIRAQEAAAEAGEDVELC